METEKQYWEKKYLLQFLGQSNEKNEKNIIVFWLQPEIFSLNGKNKTMKYKFLYK